MKKRLSFTGRLDREGLKFRIKINGETIVYNLEIVQSKKRVKLKESEEGGWYSDGGTKTITREVIRIVEDGKIIGTVNGRTANFFG